MTNPLLDTTSLPRFEDIAPDHVVPAVEQLIGEHRRRLDSLLEDADTADFESLVVPVELMEHELSRVWSPVSHLQNVLGSRAWRDAYNAALPLLTEHGTEVSQNATLQRAYARVDAALGEDTAEPARRAVQQALRDFHLAGVDLDTKAKARFKAIMQELAATQAAFEHQVQDSADAWSLHLTDARRLAGIPKHSLGRARERARSDGQEGWTLTLDYPTYDAVMTHAEDRDLRAELYRAWATRGSDKLGDGEWDNSDNIRRILALRHEAAALVGFESFAHYSLATKMADSPQAVVDFLRDLAARSRSAAERELAELTGFAGFRLEPWDVAFWLEQFKQDRFSLSNEELRQYFPAEKVIDGLFDLAARLYGVELTPRADIAVWHPDAGYYDVHSRDGTPIGGFYTDLYARSGKRSGAWIDECVGRQRLNGSAALPIGYLVCNFPPLDADGCSQLTHYEVVTLFHEFGHMLHHLLTRIDVPSVAGINGVPWDAVELPSQFMENFAWNFEVLQRCSAHESSGARLPRELFDRLEQSRNFGAGLAMLRQIELGLFDFLLHADYDPARPRDVLDVLGEVRAEVSLLQHPDYNRLPHAFSHIFAGGYAAGYYSYKWAEVLAADAFEAFVESGIFDAETATRFRREILEVGGSRDILDAYVAFRGREPTIDALLRQSGIFTS